MKNPKKTYLNTFKEHSKEELIKEMIFKEKELKSQNFEIKKMLLKISNRLHILVLFLVFISIIFILMVLYL
ncbi:hypothetical protein PHEL49_2254 [Polaribacter sp. Hel1_33_49]|nr:hypothetical protein PHEL49_2254 [Polaribacter sp. Hel1_33_49]